MGIERPDGPVVEDLIDAGLRLAVVPPLSLNDHTDPAGDDGVPTVLQAVNQDLAPLIERLAVVLTRFRGYDSRFSAALTRARSGETASVNRTDVGSCHRVWSELDELLVATVGIDRRASSEP